MKRFLPILAVLILCLTGCTSAFKNIDVTSCELEGISPVGLSSVELKLNVGVHNPAPQFTLSAISGTVKIGDKPFLLLSSSDVTIAGKSDDTYTIDVLGTLAGGINPLVAFSIIRNKDFSSLKADFKAHVTLKSGAGKDIEMKDMPLSEIIDKI